VQYIAACFDSDYSDYLLAQTCYKTAQVMATEHEQDSQAPSALIATLIA